MREVEASIATAVGLPRRVDTAAHPALTRLVSIWAGHRRWTVRKRHYERTLNRNKMKRSLTILNDKLLAKSCDPYEDRVVRVLVR